MIVNEVAHVGLSIGLEPDGSHTVTLWYHLRGGGRMQDETYSGLTWQEAIDVVDAELHLHRPGWALGDGWYQPRLGD